MAKIAVVGGHGQIALLLTAQLTARGDEVVGIIRNPDHEAAVTAAGGRPLIADLERLDLEDLTPYFAGVDAVVFAAGAGPGSTTARKRTVDYGASVLAARAAAETNVRRFIQISAIDVDEPVDPEAGPVWEAYVEAKRDADAALRATTLGWTILRPGALTNEAGTGRISLAPRIPREDGVDRLIPRADVAATVAALLDNSASVHQMFDVISGDTPITAAVAGASREPLPDLGPGLF